MSDYVAFNCVSLINLKRDIFIKHAVYYFSRYNFLFLSNIINIATEYRDKRKKKYIYSKINLKFNKKKIYIYIVYDALSTG